MIDAPDVNQTTDPAESGFTLLEILVTMVVMSLVMVAALTMLVGMVRNEDRQSANANVATISRETTELLARDLRQSNPLLAPSTDLNKSREAVIQIDDGAGFSELVRYRIDTLTTALVREVLDPATSAVVSTQILVASTANDADLVPLFRWFDQSGIEISESEPASRVECAVRVSVRLHIPIEDGPARETQFDVSMRNSKEPGTC
jgi:prepilin-type N-terminal cleavage/methylation domain-containing protein